MTAYRIASWMFAAALTTAAHGQSGTGLKIADPWLRATPNGAKVAAGYVTLSNAGGEPDRLVGGHVPFAGRVEVHEMAMADGVMRMRALSAGLEVMPGATVELKPGSFHLMFLDLQSALKEGETVSGTLSFQRAGDIPVTFKVGSIGGPAPTHEHGPR